MPAITPKQITILNTLKTQLSNINGTGSYNTTLAQVTRFFKRVEDVTADRLPCIIIIPESTAFAFKMNDYKTAGNSELDPADGWRVLLVCYIRAEHDPLEESRLQDDLIRLYADIELCINADPTISGYALQTRLINEQMSFDYQEMTGILVCELSIKYDFDPGVDP